MSSSEQFDKFERYFEIACEIFQLERDFDIVKSLSTETPSEWEIQKKRLERLKKEIDDKRAIIAHEETKPPEEIILEMKEDGKKTWEIAGILYTVYNLSSHKIGSLLPANPGTTIHSESVSKRGRLLIKKWRDQTNPKEIL